MAKKIKFENAVLCEFAAQGSNNKPILINVYSGDIITASMPANLSFGLFIEVAGGQDMPAAGLDIKLNKQRIVRVKMQTSQSAGSDW